MPSFMISPLPSISAPLSHESPPTKNAHEFSSLDCPVSQIWTSTAVPHQNGKNSQPFALHLLSFLSIVLNFNPKPTLPVPTSRPYTHVLQLNPSVKKLSLYPSQPTNFTSSSPYDGAQLSITKIPALSTVSGGSP